MTTTTTQTTQARLFAVEYVKGVAQEMLDNVKGISTKAGRITRMVLAVTMPHQIAFVLGIAPLRFDHDLRHWLESISLILASVLIPIAVDYLILTCIQAIATRGMAQPVKRAALGIMAFPVVVSGFFNIVAPAPTMVRILFGVAVLLIPMAEGLRAIIRPDFAKIEQYEQAVAASVTDEEPQPDPADLALKAQRAQAAKKAAATRAARKAAAEQAAEQAAADEVAQKAAARERRRLARLARQSREEADIAAIEAGIRDVLNGDLPQAPVSPAVPTS